MHRLDLKNANIPFWTLAPTLVAEASCVTFILYLRILPIQTLKGGTHF